jgi:hypothetical protein
VKYKIFKLKLIIIKKKRIEMTMKNTQLISLLFIMAIIGHTIAKINENVPFLKQSKKPSSKEEDKKNPKYDDEDDWSDESDENNDNNYGPPDMH